MCSKLGRVVLVSLEKEGTVVLLTKTFYMPTLFKVRPGRHGDETTSCQQHGVVQNKKVVALFFKV